MRRSELAALDLGDLELTKEGFVVSIRRSKTELGTPFALVLQLPLRLPGGGALYSGTNWPKKSQGTPHLHSRWESFPE